MDFKKLRYVDLLDPEDGTTRIKQLIKFVKVGKELRDEDGLGLDPLGGEVVLDAIKTSIQIAALKASKIVSEERRYKIEQKISGTRGEFRNLTKEINKDGNKYIRLSDIGIHHLDNETLQEEKIAKGISKMMIPMALRYAERKRTTPQQLP